MFDCIKQGLAYLGINVMRRWSCRSIWRCARCNGTGAGRGGGQRLCPGLPGSGNGHPIFARGDCFDALCALGEGPLLGGARSTMPGWTDGRPGGRCRDFGRMCSTRRRPGACRGHRSCRSCARRSRSPCARSSRFRAADAAAAATDPGDRLFAGGLPPGRHFLQQGTRHDRGSGGPDGRRAFGAAAGRRQRRQLCCNGARRTADAALPGLLRRRQASARNCLTSISRRKHNARNHRGR